MIPDSLEVGHKHLLWVKIVQDIRRPLVEAGQWPIGASGACYPGHPRARDIYGKVQKVTQTKEQHATSRRLQEWKKWEVYGKASCRFVKEAAQMHAVILERDDGFLTGNYQEMLRHFREQWLKYFRPYEPCGAPT